MSLNQKPKLFSYCRWLRITSSIFISHARSSKIYRLDPQTQIYCNKHINKYYIDIVYSKPYKNCYKKECPRLLKPSFSVIYILYKFGGLLCALVTKNRCKERPKTSIKFFFAIKNYFAQKTIILLVYSLTMQLIWVLFKENNIIMQEKFSTTK